MMNCDECPYTDPVDCSDAKKIENNIIVNQSKGIKRETLKVIDF